MARDFNDRMLARLLSRTPFYAEGWGDDALIDEVLARMSDRDPPAPIEVRWTDVSPTVSHGWFRTPASHLPLPPQARTAYFRLELPERAPEDEERPPPVCVYLAATGDQGYAARRFVSAPLVRRGIGSLVLENPYYGVRKPRGQRYVAPRRFVDQLMMNYATVEEARSLLQWLTGRGFETVGVSGYSMGGFMAAYVAAAMPFAIAAVPAAAGNSAGPTFLESPLSQVPDWEALGADHDDPRARFLELVDANKVDSWEPPVDPQSAIIVGLEDDAIIPPSEVKALHAAWPGSRLRWVAGGHMSGILGRMKAVREAVYDAFAIRIAKGAR